MIDFYILKLYNESERSGERSLKNQEDPMATRKITLKEVAVRAGVSYQTVSKVLNRQTRVSKETEQRILAAVRELG
ncbi:MAG TPA: LacI family DNA-binding transcriptional regulator, partial [Anaerolineales bacterium]|nr:LacI family DNA-binding transcriptional regulator [Anaerolineales bacterium]